MRRHLSWPPHARILNDQPKAIEYYESLDKGGATNDDVQFALAALYKDTGAYDKARKRFAQLLARDPKYIEALLGAGQVESWSGKRQRRARLPESRAHDGDPGRQRRGQGSVLRTLGGTYGRPEQASEAYSTTRSLLHSNAASGALGGVADNAARDRRR